MSRVSLSGLVFQAKGKVTAAFRTSSTSLQLSARSSDLGEPTVVNIETGRLFEGHDRSTSLFTTSTTYRLPRTPLAVPTGSLPHTDRCISIQSQLAGMSATQKWRKFTSDLLALIPVYLELSKEEQLYSGHFL